MSARVVSPVRSRGDKPHFPFLCLSDASVNFSCEFRDHDVLMITCGSRFLRVQGVYFPSASCALLLLSPLGPPPETKKYLSLSFISTQIHKTFACTVKVPEGF